MTKHKALTINGHRINLTLETSKPTDEQIQQLDTNLDNLDEHIKAEMMASFKDMTLYRWHASLKSFLDTKDEALMKRYQDEVMFQTDIQLVGSYDTDEKYLYVSSVDETDGLENIKANIRQIVEWNKKAKTVTK